MLRIYPSNKTESLSAVMGALMKSRPLANPFSSETVLIQSQGMGTWLRQQISTELGVAALIETQMPAGFVWKLAQGLMSDQGVSPQFEKATLRWELLKCLPALLDRDAFRPLKEYLRVLEMNQGGHDSDDSIAAGQAGAGGGYSQAVLFQLCDVLADSFDAYQNYRADWVRSWEAGEFALSGQPEHIAGMECWQSELWRAIYPDLPAESRLHRPRQLEALCQLLESGEFSKALLPERLFVFGLSALPPQWLPVFVLLARYIDIHFLIQNPCRYYWGDVQTELQQLRYRQSLQAKGLSDDTNAEQFVESNSLLASWGRLGRDYLSTLYQYDETQGVTEFDAPLFDDWLVERDSGDGHRGAGCVKPSALHCLQQDLLELRSAENVVGEEDRSIRFASCHSGLREVEALKDYILNALDSDETLALKDIIVMMPDVQDYAPLIDAVFSQSVMNVSGQAQTLRYAISDQSVAYDLSLIEWLQQLLIIDQSRVTSTQVLDWLNVDVIRRRFGIEEADLGLLHSWIDYLNIRWGLSSDHRVRLSGSFSNAAGTDNNTWLSATRRLVFGYLCGEDTVMMVQGKALLPVALGGRDAQVLLGKLLRFIEVIESSIYGLEGKKTGPQWVSCLYELIRSWVDMDAVQPAFTHLCDTIFRQLREQWLVSEFDDVLPFSVLAQVISSQLEQERVSQRFLAGRINFCTLMPMRSIPFKVVCLLGMNEGQYPRPVNPSSFDLMAVTPVRVGDRSRREDDRYLFLEALLSVRERLYISYRGKNVQDNSERYPSVLVSELREYCGRYFRLPEGIDDDFACDDDECALQKHRAKALLNKWTQTHRLQAFHPQYFDAEQPRSYAQEWLGLHRVSGPSHGPSVEPVNAVRAADNDAAKPELLTLNTITRAFNHPLRYYYKQSFHLNSPHLDAALEEVEPFALDSLEQFQLKQDLLINRSGAGQQPVDVGTYWQLSERMPSGVLGAVEVAKAEQNIAPLRHTLSQLDPPAYGEFDVTLGRSVVSARVLHSAGTPIAVYSGTSAASAFFGFWVQHVFWNLARHQADDFSVIVQAPVSGESQMVGNDKAWCLPALDADLSQAYAQSLLEVFLSFHQRPYMLMPKTAFAGLLGSMSQVNVAFFGANGGGGSQGENQDFYWRRACLLSPLVRDPDALPDFKNLEVVAQIQTHVDEIKELSR